jgi:hypothetical protein
MAGAAGAETGNGGAALLASLDPGMGLALLATDCTNDGAMEVATATNASVDMLHLQHIAWIFNRAVFDTSGVQITKSRKR